MGKIASDMKQTTMSRTQNVSFTPPSAFASVESNLFPFPFAVINFSCCCTNRIHSNWMKWEREKKNRKKSWEIGSEAIEVGPFLKYVKYGCIDDDYYMLDRVKDIENILGRY